MSEHVVTQEEKKYVFGWDQPLQSFYFQVHDSTRAEDEQIIAWLGADSETQMYEIEELTTVAMQYGLMIDHPTRVELYGERDDGR